MAWVGGSLIDDRLGLTGSERRQVLDGAWSRWFKAPSNVLLYTGGLLAAILAFLFVPNLLAPVVGGNTWWMWLIWLSAYASAMMGLILLAIRFNFAPCVYAELRERGHDLCSRCGYPLGDIPADERVCPECGTGRTPLPRVPQNKPTEP